MLDGDLHKLFKKYLPDLHLQRIETGGTGLGIPDTNGAASGGIEFWIEYKTTDGWVLGLRPEQLAWVSRRARMGCRVWVAVRRKAAAGARRGAAADELWMVPGRSVIAVHTITLRPIAKDGPGGTGVHVWRGGPTAWDWDAVRGLLLRWPV